MNRLKSFLHTSLMAACIVTGSFVLGACLPRPSYSATKIRILAVGPLVFDLAVEDLETFANTGEVTGSFKFYARFLDPELLEQLRSGLNTEIPLDVVLVDHLSSSPLGRDALFNLGKILRVHPAINGQTALQAAVIGAAANADADGWTMLDALKAFPTNTLDIRLGDLLALRRKLDVYLSYNNAVIAAIQAQAQAEAASQTAIDPAALPDLSQPGPFAFETRTVTVTNPAVRQTPQGLSVNYDFDSDVYVPTGLTAPAPIVIISHGFGDVKESFTFLAEHLASHGFIAIIPEHVGSDLAYRQEYLNGRLNTLLSPVEFINRPQEISFLIDKLEELTATSPEWAALADLDSIGVAGDSLGTATALALAGAEISYRQLVEKCEQDTFIVNFSLYLQCRARFLPPQNYELRDPRIKAVVAGHPVGGGMYGPEGFRQIQIPLLMVAGSKDIVATAVTEQIHPFVWLETQPKYLALMDVGTHFSSKPGRVDIAASEGDQFAAIFNLLIGQHRDVGSRYYKTLSVAFWNLHLRQQQAYAPYLTAGYGQLASADQPMALDIISRLSAEQLQAAYGRRPPIPVLPPTPPPVPPRPQSVLAEIQQSGVLRVGLRKDAAPFGFINRRKAWDGYCGSLALALRDHLSEQLGEEMPIQVVELTSTVSSRYDLVRNGSVHVECGPNTIREDVEGIVFSNPFFVSSAQFLTRSGEPIDPDAPLAGLRLGVLSDTTSETFVQATYPQAERVAFSGPEGRKEAIEAVGQGDIDAFVGDGILSYATLLLEEQTDQFELLPQGPLTCEFYGLALPNNDPEWRTTVNRFLASERQSTVATTWFTDLYPQTLNQAEFCLNR